MVRVVWVVRPHRGGQHWGEEETLARLGDDLPALLSVGGGRRWWGRRHRQDLIEVLGLRRTVTLAVTGAWWTGPRGRRRILLASRVDWAVGTGQSIAGRCWCLNTLPSWLSFSLHLLVLFGNSGLKHKPLTLHSITIIISIVHLKCTVQHVHQLGVLGGAGGGPEADRSLGWQLALTDQTGHGGDER